MHALIRPLVAVAAASLCLGAMSTCGDESAKPDVATPGATASLPDIPNARLFREGIVTGGTPSPDAVREAKRMGYEALVSLQPFDEAGAREAYEAAKGAGLEVRHIPVADGDALTFERARELTSALETLPRPLIVHCSSGNRVGGLFALAAHLEGEDLETALAIGRDAGMTKIESAARERIREAEE